VEKIAVNGIDPKRMATNIGGRYRKEIPYNPVTGPVTAVKPGTCKPQSRVMVEINVQIRGEMLDALNAGFFNDPVCTKFSEYVRKIIGLGLTRDV
jgi:hypothetical protein